MNTRLAGLLWRPEEDGPEKLLAQYRHVVEQLGFHPLLFLPRPSAPSLPRPLDPWETWLAGGLHRDFLSTPAHHTHWALHLSHQMGFLPVPWVNHVTTILSNRLGTLVINDHALSLPPISIVSPKPVETASENTCNVADVTEANLYTESLGAFGHPLFGEHLFECLQQFRPYRMTKEKTKVCVGEEDIRK